MPHPFYLASWALISLSLFNGLALLWLGLTMFLAAEERQYGLWLVLLGISMGGLFFLSHTMILLQQLTIISTIWVEGWWRLGWIPVIMSPLLWYLMILWYVGLGEAGSEALAWHQYTRFFLVGIGVFLLLLHGFAHPLPDFQQITFLNFSNTLSWQGIPLMLILFPPYALLCVSLPLHALQHPAPPRRMMADLARERARPWLMISSSLLMIVALIVAFFIILSVTPLAITERIRQVSIFVFPMLMLDLSVTAMIAVAIIILGKAVVSYEIFTGKVLPRGGFSRQWANAVYFTGIISAFIAYSMVFGSHFIYGFIALAGISVVAFALLSWGSFLARDETIASLRPFVSGQGMMQEIIAAETDAFSHAQQMLKAICEEFLHSNRAQISPMNTLASLIPAPLIHPRGQAILPVSSVGQKIQQLEPKDSAGFRWLLPLWSERGLIGALLLGDKRDGGLYTEEEMQVAQAAAERILDTLASEQIARSLIGIQRRRIVEQRVMDFQTRRSLHDDSLPRIHAAILSLSSLKDPAAREAIQSLSEVHQEISQLIHSSPRLAEEESDDFFTRSQAAIQNEFASEFERIDWSWPEKLPRLDTLSADVLFAALREIIRNAAIHGRGNNSQRALQLSIQVSYNEKIKICVQDNGVGLEKSQYRGGSGSGLSLHSTLLALVGGSLEVKAADTGGTIVTVFIEA